MNKGPWPLSWTQFLAALDYIRRDRPSAALRFRIKAGRILLRLEKHPFSGRPLPEFPDLPYREVVVSPYRFFYRVRRRTVWIVAVWHGAQLPRRPGS